MNFFKRLPKRRPVNPFDTESPILFPDAVIVYKRYRTKRAPQRVSHKSHVDIEVLFDMTPLPRVAQIGDRVLSRDTHIPQLCEEWRIERYRLNRRDTFGEFKLLPGWRSAFSLNGFTSELLDADGNTRARIVTPEFDRAVLLILPRYHATVEHDETERMRAVVIDRVGRRKIRTGLWRSSGSSVQIDLALFNGWLDGTSPAHRNPFAYWGDA